MLSRLLMFREADSVVDHIKGFAVKLALMIYAKQNIKN
jgi:hypothetical protein